MCHYLKILRLLVAPAMCFIAALPVAAQSPGSFDGQAELPRVYIKSSLADTPAPGKVWKLKAGDSVQEALNRAGCGDILELPPAATFDGSFALPSKPCDDSHWIVLRTASSDSSLPGEGTRITPCYAGIASLPGRPASPCDSAQNVMSRIGGSKGNNKIVRKKAGANRYRL